MRNRVSNRSGLFFCVVLAGCASTGQTPAAVEPAAEDDANAAIAAAVPSTDIVMVDLPSLLAGEMPTRAVNVVQRRGYDNQPAFSADGRSVWFASITDDQQSDVYRYDIATARVSRVTDTPESEYSPTPLDGGGFSCVQVALDGTQRLWRYTVDGRAEHAIRADVTGVGYHSWLDARSLALFIVAEPMRLDLVTLDNQPPRTLATNIGRSLHRTSTGALAYVQHAEDGPSVVMEYDPALDRRRLRATLPFEGEDLVWLADGSALTANARSIYRLQPRSTQWEMLGNLARSVHGDITRMAVDPNGQWLALVVGETER